ncbi:MAG: hypothetical protein LKJ76_06345 [Lachnospiraceae bacterium]|jgi:tetratricopeptide (TPR) repeat protein|nr:hypothetical protein [Lachnospiraceae bacterium]
MSGLLLTTGKRTSDPYHIAVIDRNVYSVEELCYSIAQSAQFLDDTIMDPALVSWLSDKCGMPDLARTLKGMLGSPERLADFAAAILSCPDYLPGPVQEEALRVLRAGEGLEKFEQKEARADYLMDSGHFYQALNEYDRILSELPEPERRMRARIEHSRGVIYCRMFRFSMAAESFHAAYDRSGDSGYYRDYLAAVRLYLPDADYVAFVAGHPEAYDASLELERRMDDANLNYSHSGGGEQMVRLRRLRGSVTQEEFRGELASTVREMRENYRTNLSV